MSVTPCRILYLVGGLGVGGYERQLWYLLRSMDRDRFKPEVAIWSSEQTQFYADAIRQLGVTLHELPPRVAPARKLRMFRTLCRRLKPEVLHSYSFYTNCAAAFATFGSTSIAIGSLRNDFVTETRIAGPVLGRLSARYPRAQICNSEATQQAVLNARTPFKPANIAFVRNGLDMGLFLDRPIPAGDPVVVGIGSLRGQKRWDRFVDIVARLVQRGARFRARLLGDGPLRVALETQAARSGVSGAIEFLGMRHDIPTQLADASMLLHTADREGCPNVVMEAMAAGRAVVASDVGEIPALVADGVSGFVVRRDEQPRFCDRVLQLLHDRVLCENMGRAARVRAEAQFGLDRLVQQTLAAYRSAGWSG